MRKYALLAAAVASMIFLFSAVVAADGNDDLQAIKKAVQENPNYEAGKEVQWFKILVTDNKTNKEVAKVTLPISAVELFLNCANVKDVKINQGEADIDVQALFKELKALGPKVLLEVSEDDETVKIWLE